MQTTTILLGIVLLFTLYRVILSFLKSRQQRAFAKAHGCQPPVTVPTKPLGIDKWLQIYEADKKGTLTEVIAARYQHGNTWTMPLLMNTVMHTCEPENIKSMLATNFKDWELGKRRHDTFEALLGDGIFTLDGQGWEHSRALLRPQFARDQISDLDALEIHIQRLLSLLPKDGTTVDVQPLFYGLTLDSATEFLFGESVNSLLSSDHANNLGSNKDNELNFAEAFNGAQNRLSYSLRFNKFYWLAHNAEFWKNVKFVHNFVDHFVDLALNPEKHDKKKVEEKGEGRYVFLEQLALQTRDPKVLRDQMLNILLAGRDTTASLLGWSFHMLAKHPQVYQKLRNEVLTAFGTGRDGTGVKPTWTGLKDIVYLRYVLNEVLRLYPAVPVNFRSATCDTTLPVGGGPDGLSPVFVPKGQTIGYLIYVLHRRKDIYGDDAELFRPERWGEGSRLGRNWEYLPFNGGPRICLGQQYALTEAGYTLVRICQHFENIQSTGVPLRVEQTLTMAPKQCFVKLYGTRE